MTNNTTMDIEENLKKWATRFNLTQSTIQALRDEGFTSTLILAELTPETIDDFFPDLSLDQILILKQAVKSLQIEDSQATDLSSKVDLPGPSSDASRQPQVSSIVEDRTGTRRDHSTEKCSITGVSGGHASHSNIAGINYGTQRIEGSWVQKTKLHGTLGKSILEMRTGHAKDILVETEIYKKIKDNLKESGHVTICGASGEGKTTMSLVLGSCYRDEGYETVFVNRLETFDLDECVSSSPRLFLIVDDIFGTVGMSANIAEIRKFLGKLTTYIEHCRKGKKESQYSEGSVESKMADLRLKQPSKKDIVVVFSSKTYNFNLGVSQLHSFKNSLFSEKTVVDLTEMGNNRYSPLEMKAIFERHREKKNKDCEEDISVESLLDIRYKLFGFPMICKLFFQFSSLNKNPKEFFKDPLYYLREELNTILSLQSDKSAAMILMLLCDDTLDLKKLERESDDCHMEDMIKVTTDLVPSVTRMDISQAARNFIGTYFIGGDSLSFSHPSIYDACACELYKLNPSFVLRYCSDNFIYERVKSEMVDATRVDDYLHFICVSEQYLDIIAMRITKSIMKGHFAKSVTHPILSEERVLKNVLKTLEDKERNSAMTRESFNSLETVMYLREDKKERKTNTEMENSVETIWYHKKDREKCFLYWGAFGHSPVLIQAIETELKCTFTQEEIIEGIEGSVTSDNLILLQWLHSRVDKQEFDLKKDDTFLLAAANSSSDAILYLLEEGADINSTDERMNNVLHLICKNGQIDLLKKLRSRYPLFLSKGNASLISTEDINGQTPVMLAAFTASYPCFQFLKSFSDLTITDKGQNGILHLACLGGNEVIVQDCLSPSNINSRGEYGRTPVMIAASTGHQAMFDLLVSKNADLQQVDNKLHTLLHLACVGGNKYIVECVVSSTDINKRELNGKTPIMMAALGGHHSLFELLVSKGADLTLENGIGNTLLDLACWGGNSFIVQDLLASSDIDSTGYNGMTPIMTAAVSGKQGVFELLLTKKPDLDKVDDDGNTSLHLACMGENTYIAECLVSSSNINRKSLNGNTPVMAATVSGNRSLFELLVSKGADLTQKDRFGNTLFLLACYSGNLSLVQYLLPSSNIDITGVYGWTPVMIAAFKGYQAMFHFLMSEEPDLNVVDADGNSILHLACYGGINSIVKRLLSPSIINGRGQRGSTPVMIAAAKGNYSVFELLVTNRADLNMKDYVGKTLLHFACKGGNMFIVQYLLPLSNINSREDTGHTPVMIAAAEGKQAAFEVVAQRADLTLKDGFGNSLLHHACQSGNKFIVQYILLQSKIGVNVIGQNGFTPLQIAVAYGHLNVFDLLVSKKADLTVKGFDNDSLLHNACYGGNRFIVQYLLPFFAVDIKGRKGNTPVMISALYGYQSLFELLASKDADLSLKNGDGNSLLHLACRGGDTFIVQYLLSLPNIDINIRGQNGNTPVMIAALNSRKSLFKLLVSREADLTVKDIFENSLLHLACEGGDMFIVQYLLPFFNINIRGVNGNTPVMIAAMKGQLNLFELLVSKGADLRLMDFTGNSVLHLACQGGNMLIIDFILPFFNINIKGLNDYTPVMMSAWKGNPTLFRLLVSEKADITVKDIMGNSLLHVACEGGNKFIVQYLLSQPNTDINMKGQNGLTPVMIAAVNRHLEVFDLLVSRNADLFQKDIFGNDLIEIACQGFCKAIISRLKCGWCTKPCLKSCTQCRTVRYCSKTCQKQHWKKGHKDICKSLVEKLE